MSIVWITIETLMCVLGGGENWKIAIEEAVTIKYIPSIWFVWVIIALYFIFYLVFRHMGFYAGIKAFAGIVLIYILVSVFINSHDEMYASIIGMPLGVIYAAYQERLDTIFGNRFYRNELVLVTLFFAFFVGRLGLALIGVENDLIHTLLRNFITALFVVTLIGIVKKIQISNRILLWLGIVLYEIYIIHTFLFYAMENEKKAVVIVPDLLIVGVVICGTLVFAWLLQRLSSLIIGILKKMSTKENFSYR